MQVTRIRTDSLTPRDNGVCGEFTVTLDGALCIHKILVINGRKGLFIAFPPSEMKIMDNQKKYTDLVHPTTQEFRQDIENKVLEHYQHELMQQSEAEMPFR